MSIISLLSDFGNKDPYVAEMKAIILAIYPEARIVDISHEIRRFDIRMGAYVLASAAPYFPTKTVHMAVVDPGVGTKRRSIIVETSRGFYVGPDNGLLMPAAQKEGSVRVYQIDNKNYMLPQVSKTFHGRDIFAPAAAHLAGGIKASKFGLEIHDYVFPQFVKSKIRKGVLVGEVLHLDGFGNIISNISADMLKKYGVCEGDSIFIGLGSKHLSLKLRSTYDEVQAGSPLVLVGSSEFLEVAVNQGSASEIFAAKVGDPFCVSRRISS